MNEHDVCPKCESFDTERVWSERYWDEWRETWICGDCPAEWVVSFGNPAIEEIL